MNDPVANVGSDPQAVWLVTGCSSGFGKALSAALHARGTRLAATARHVAALDHLPDGGDRLTKFELDVTRPASVEGAVAATLSRFGRLDVVVNNAGIGVIGPVEDVTDEQTRLQFEVNVFGVLNVVRATAPVFRAQKRGLYVNIASMAGEASQPSLGIYSASKFAVEGLSEALRDELGPHGVRVLVVEPGPFNTKWIGQNAVWAKEDRERYPGVWEAVDVMRKAYADRAVVGDPARAAEAIIATADLADPPFRLPLHEMSLGSTRAKCEAVAADMDRMDAVSRAVHYDHAHVTRSMALTAGAVTQAGE